MFSLCPIAINLSLGLNGVSKDFMQSACKPAQMNIGPATSTNVWHKTLVGIKFGEFVQNFGDCF